jgi:hypothetical protein
MIDSPLQGVAYVALFVFFTALFIVVDRRSE